MCVSSLTTIARRVHTAVEPTTHHSDVKTNQINNEFATIVMSVGKRGHIVKQCKQSTICNYCKKKRDISGVHVTNTKWIRCDRIMETILPTS